MKILSNLFIVLALMLLVGCQATQIESESSFSNVEKEDTINQQRYVIRLYDGKIDSDVIKVTKGKELSLEIVNLNDDENDTLFMIEEFDIYETIGSGKTTEITFVPDQTGSFEFGLRKEIIKGQLVVE